MLAFAAVVATFSPHLHTPRSCSAALMCASAGQNDLEAWEAFDLTLSHLLGDAASCGSMSSAVEAWLPRLDEGFMPELGARIENAPPDSDALPLWRELMEELQARSLQGFERARDQLASLLESGEINKLDAALSGLVRREQVDAGLFYVLARNMESARAEGDEQRLRLYTHLHTRLQEELEKRTEPGLALLHKLTRTESAQIRDNVLRKFLVPATTVWVADGSEAGGRELPLSEPAPALVEPLSFAAAVETALDKVLRMGLERALIEQTAEEVRQVAKEARAVVAEEYSAEVLDEFTERLTPAFNRALTAGFRQEN